jgi:hypothetical protein
MKFRRPVLKRRPTTTEAQIRTFAEKVRVHLDFDPRNIIINIDETNWRTVAAGFLTWQPITRDVIESSWDIYESDWAADEFPVGRDDDSDDEEYTYPLDV